MSVYCMQCQTMNCKEAAAAQTGWVFVNMETGRKDANGVKVNAGFHPEK